VDPKIETLFRVLEYKPWQSQRIGHESQARFKALFAGARYGKSLWAAREVLKELFLGAKEDVYRVWLVGPKYEQPSKEFRYIYRDMLRFGYSPKKKLNVDYSTPGPQYLLYEWQSSTTGKPIFVEISTKSEENSDGLLGEEIDLLVLSEGSRIKEVTYDTYLRARLGTRIGKVIVPTTPRGYNWLYRRFYLPSTKRQPGYWATITSVLENDLFSRDEYEQAKQEIPPEIFDEQYDGKFVAYTGLIYKRFNYQEHVIEPFELPRDPRWAHYMSVDPHPQTPCAVLWVAQDPHGTLIAYDELFVPDKTIPEVVELIAMKEKDRPEINKRLIDPNAKMIDKLRGQITSVQQQFRSEGLYCLEANNKFESAYYLISKFLTPQPVYGNDKLIRPQLFVFNTCEETIHEFMTCDWGNEKDNHMLDNYKYIVNDIAPPQKLTEQEKAELEEQEEMALAGRDSRTGY
tara:strand:- start:5786 stop:7162 length:1377 start_codon:yes stop_codon:yes gene_type:complete